MKKSLKRVITIIVLLALICGGIFYLKNNEKKNIPNLKVVLGSEPNSLDPAISLTIDVRSYLSNLYEGLVNINEKGEVLEGVSNKWETNDNNTEYTFHIRKDAKWSDGTEVTAKDFKYSWLRVLDPKTASGWASYLYYIKGAEAYNSGTGSKEDVGLTVVDDKTLKVTLESPCSFFTSMTALQPYYPVKEKVVSKNPEWASSKETYITNGAFELDSWKHDEKIVIKKSENYWNKNKIHIDKINFELLSDSTVVINSYESGDLDFVQNMATYDEMKQVGTISSSDFVYTKFLALNSNSEVLKNDKVREAISIALDRKELSKLMGSGINPLTSFVPYGFYNTSERKDYTEDSNSKTYLKETAEIEKAKKLIKESGLDNIELTYLTNTSSTNIALSEIVKEQLSKVGITVNIQALEKKVFNEYRRGKKFDIVAASWAAEYPDISSYLYGFRSTDVNNYSGFSSKEFDSLYKKIITEDNQAKKFKYTHDAENLVMDSSLIIPLYSEGTYYLKNEKLTNAYHDVTGCLIIKYAYFK